MEAKDDAAPNAKKHPDVSGFLFNELTAAEYQVSYSHIQYPEAPLSQQERIAAGHSSNALQEDTLQQEEQYPYTIRLS